MPENILKTFAILVLIFLSSAIHAQSLWQKTTIGMSPSKVKSLYSKSFTPKVLDSTGPQGNESQDLLWLNGLELATRKFTVKFFFHENKLVQVTLIPSGELSNSDVKPLMDELFILLRSKYGQEFSSTKNENELMSSSTNVWKSGPTSVRLSTFLTDKTPAFISLVYQATIANDADKL